MIHLPYFDYHATTPMDPRVFEAMTPYFMEKFGNAHSGAHAYGYEADAAVEAAREQVAAGIGAEPREIIFTSGATESNNIAIQGAALFHQGRKDHIVSVVTEHKCVLNSALHMKKLGFEITLLPVGVDGLIDLDQIAEAISERTAVVSVMGVNNEIGVIQPLAEIGKLCREKRISFHTDGAQAIGRIALNVNDMNIDLMSLSGHKVYGPKGIGALYVRRRPRARLLPLFQGGGQERGVCSGTLPVPLIVAMGQAVELATGGMKAEMERVGALRSHVWDSLSAGLDGVHLNGCSKRRVAGNLNISFQGVEGSELLAALTPHVALSSGSACTSAEVESSYVLRALGVPDGLAHASIRIGLGRFTSKTETDRLIEVCVEQVTRLRADSGQRACGADRNPGLSLATPAA